MRVTLERAGSFSEEELRARLGIRRGRELDTFRGNLLNMIQAGEISREGEFLEIEPHGLNSEVENLRQWLKANLDQPLSINDYERFKGLRPKGYQVRLGLDLLRAEGFKVKRLPPKRLGGPRQAVIS
ncbi:MAG: hypothetical protein AB1473_23035 [Thermodesulfobacteriota bacterium]